MVGKQSVKKAAEQAGVSVSTMYRLIGQGKLKVSRPSPRTIRISDEELARLVAPLDTKAGEK